MHGMDVNEEINYRRERAKRAEQQLATMTAARDEACEIAKQSTYCLFDREERERRHTRIAELLKVGG